MVRTTVNDTTGAQFPTRLLVFGMAHPDGTVLASELYPVAEACGLSPEQVRSCLRRLAREGLLKGEGNGRDARFLATPSGMGELGFDIERTRVAYAQDSAGSGWDRHWRLVGFAIPEKRRSARDSLRDHLIRLGGAAIQGGLYVSPHPWHKDVMAEAHHLHVIDHVTAAVTDDLSVGRDSDPREIVRRLWPIDQLANKYRHFITQYNPVLDALREMDRSRVALPDEVFLPSALTMAVAFRGCFESDPLLPPELLPRPWPGRAARDIVVKSRRLALSLREKQGRPSLFRIFDDIITEVTP